MFIGRMWRGQAKFAILFAVPTVWAFLKDPLADGWCLSRAKTHMWPFWSLTGLRLGGGTAVLFFFIFFFTLL